MDPQYWCAGKSKRGELSLFPVTFQVLSPCLHMLPLQRLDNQVTLSMGAHLPLAPFEPDAPRASLWPQPRVPWYSCALRAVACLLCIGATRALPQPIPEHGATVYINT